MNTTTARRRIVILDAPSNLGLRPLAEGHEPGARRMASALRDAGIVAALDADDAGAVAAPAYSPHWRAGAGTRNELALAEYSSALADRVTALIGGDRLVVVLGGDCSVLLGPMLALRRMGRYGLIFLDGHLDFRHPGNSPHVAAAAGEDLALVTGRGDDALANLEGRRPLVADSDVVALGFREGPNQGEFVDILRTGILLMDLPAVRDLGVEAAAQTALQRLGQLGLDGIWVHCDVDVIDSDLLPAVDSPMADGLSWDEFRRLLRTLRGAPTTVGLDFTIFDPDLDPDQSLAATLTAAIVEGLRTQRRLGQ